MKRRTLIKRLFSEGRSITVNRPIAFGKTTRYIGTFKRFKPCLRTAINTGVVMATGDVIAQCFLEKKSAKNVDGDDNDDSEKKSFDWLRLSRYLVIGVFLAGPGMFYWYSALDRWIVIGSLRSRALKKFAADQIFFLPFYILVYMVSLAMLRRDGRKKMTEQVKNQFGDNLVASYKLWPAVQLVNFLLVPGRFRVPLINFFALFWNTYLGWRTEAFTAV